MPMQWLDVENVKLPWIETARPTKEAIQCNVGRANLFNQETAADVSCAEQIWVMSSFLTYNCQISSAKAIKKYAV